MGASIVLILSAFYFSMSLSLPPLARMFPQIVTVVTGVLAIIWLISSFADQVKKPEKISIEMSPKLIKLLTFLFIQLFAYVFLNEVLGFYVTTFIFLMVGMCTLGYRRYGYMAAISMTLLVIIKIVFDGYLNVKLPPGYFF